MIDYLDRLDVSLMPEEGNTRLRHQDRNIAFLRQRPDTLRPLLNAGMAVAAPHYAANVARSGVAVDARHIEEASLRVVCHTLYIYNQWRATSLPFKRQRLTITAEDLQHVQSHDECLFYCRKTFDTEYPVYAAALIGMTADEFAQYEAGRERFWNR